MLRRRIVELLVGALTVGVLAWPGTAAGARVITLETQSRFVDPDRVEFAPLPPGVPSRSSGTLRVLVLLPDGYDGRRRFPVLYLLHGALIQTPYMWLNGPDAKGIDLRRLRSRPRAVVVMPEGGFLGFYSNWWRNGERGGPGWERYHLDELVPLIERRFRIRPERRWHAIAGWSMGGFGALYYATQRPGYFGSVAALSGAGIDAPGPAGAQIWGDPVAQRFYWRGHDPVELADALRNTRVLVDVGDARPRSPAEAANSVGISLERGALEASRRFVARARARGVRVTSRIRPGIHHWDYIPRATAWALRTGLFRPVVDRPRTWTYRTVAQVGDAFGFRFSFRRPPDQLVTFRRRGATLTATGAGTVRLTTREGERFVERLPFSRRLSR